eukprot:scaffold11531_cov21-Tisochrysis_lutea.AAC.1
MGLSQHKRLHTFESQSKPQCMLLRTSKQQRMVGKCVGYSQSKSWPYVRRLAVAAAGGSVNTQNTIATTVNSWLFMRQLAFTTAGGSIHTHACI